MRDLLLINLLLQKIFIEYKHMIQQCVDIFVLDLQTLLVYFHQIIFKNDDMILNYFKIGKEPNMSSNLNG